MSSPQVTEVLYLDIDRKERLKNATDLDDRSTGDDMWSRLLAMSERSNGFVEQYWSRGWESPTQVRLHIVRQTLQQHLDFHDSSSGHEFDKLCRKLCLSDMTPKTRFVIFEDFVTANGRARDAPITGTGIWNSTDEIWNSLVWPLWTHIVRYAPGCKGVTGGRVVDRLGVEEGYLVYVGWDTQDAHEAFRQSDEYQGKRAILKMGNAGRAEYHHVVFQEDAQKAEHWMR